MESKFAKWLPKKNQWLIVLLAGILLVVIAIPTKQEEKKRTEVKKETEGTCSTEMEQRLEDLLSNMQDVGKVQVMITSKENGQVEGIVVLAEGAKNGVVVKNITEVVQALFDVDAHKIKVIRSNFNH